MRSFGSDPELVARHVAAFVAGTQRQGVAACAKHFPGHGDTAADSHRELPLVRGDLDDALLPFRAAIAAGVRAVMTGHLLVPALDDAPATISAPILSVLLRGELGLDGLVVTDALEMEGISGLVGVEEAAVLALAVAVRVQEAPRDLAALLAEHEGRLLVVVVRDAARHEWQQATVAAATALRRDAIVVETGIPGRRPEGVASIVTHGAGRANLAAAAEALSGLSFVA